MAIRSALVLFLSLALTSQIADMEKRAVCKAKGKEYARDHAGLSLPSRMGAKIDSDGCYWPKRR